MPSGLTRRRRVRVLLALLFIIAVAILYTRRTPQATSYAATPNSGGSGALPKDGEREQYRPVEAAKLDAGDRKIVPQTTSLVATTSVRATTTSARRDAKETIPVQLADIALELGEDESDILRDHAVADGYGKEIHEGRKDIKTTSAPASTTTSGAHWTPNQELGEDELDILRDSVVADGYDEEVYEGKKEIQTTSALALMPTPGAHWIPIQENFPVTSTIQLPAATAKAFPRIQDKSASSGKIDQKRLSAVKAAAKYAWEGYRERAFGADEVKPVSGGFNNPFNGWGATLVDSLDTLWIMNMTDAFEEAVDAVRSIDFTFSVRPDIPLFETTIRYLGGLVAAYDVSGQKYRILLDKAVELAEILYGAFDTPNRMPETYYRWNPAFAGQPHRASSSIVLAELGTLSLEFTRLAQLTHEPKFYDAIARITDALEAFQNNTRVPGLWPTRLDGSGCQKSKQFDSSQEHSVKAFVSGGDGEEMVASFPVHAEAPLKHSQQQLREDVKLQKPGTGKILGFNDPILEGSLDRSESRKALLGFEEDVQESKPQPHSGGKIIGFGNSIDEGVVDGKSLDTIEKSGMPAHKRDESKDRVGKPACIEQGLASRQKLGTETFTLGGMSDSTYEYLLKQYILLGGAVKQYKSMYIATAEVAAKKLLFRPMTPDNLDILIAGPLVTNFQKGDDRVHEKLDATGDHLSCFAGGMFAMGGKLFDRPQDVEIGRRLTDGCVWTYNSTASGIMPEMFAVVRCEDERDCTWNEARYQALLAGNEKLWPGPTAKVGKHNKARVQKTNLNKRQLDGTDYEASDALPQKLPDKPATKEEPPKPKNGRPPHPWNGHSSQSADKARLNAARRERLPRGFIAMDSAKYILRPEAIESVFYMYRITGEQYWRDVGWQMFLSIEKHTHAEYGHAAIDDVTLAKPNHLDSMESFWMAETLKYFYLLFDDKNTWSLDEWVLNTEAHFFRRPPFAFEE